MAIQAAGPGRPVTDEQRIRYQPCYNGSNYDAPPYAAMLRDHGTASGAEDDTRFAGTIVDGQYVVNVGRCDAAAELRQRPADWVFNGPEVLRSKRTGRCTEDFPAKALHLVSDVLHRKPASPVNASGLYAGPKADSWLLWDSGFAFRWLGEPEQRMGADKQFMVGLVAPANPLPFNGGQLTAPLQTVAVLDAIGQDQSFPWTAITDEPFTTTAIEARAGGTAKTSGIKFLLGGIYEWSFHCTLSSATAPQGAGLTLRAYLDDSTLYSYGLRVEQLEIDNYGNEISRSSENVAFSGHVVAAKDQVLNFRNASAYSVLCNAVFCLVRRVGP